MRIKILGAAIAAVALWPASGMAQQASPKLPPSETEYRQALPVTEESLAAGRRLTRAMEVPDSTIRLFEQFMPQIFSALSPAYGMRPEDQQRFIEIYTEEMRAEVDSLVETTARLYARRLSVADMNAAAAFFESDAGRRILTQMRETSGETAAVGEAWARERVNPRVEARLQAFANERRQQQP
jgi:hypothetical protein